MRARALATVLLMALLIGCSSAGSGAPAPQASAPGGAAPAAQSAPAAGSEAQPAPALRKVRMALAFIGTEVLPVYVAQDQGIYQKYGLDVATTVMQSSAQ